MDIQYRKIISLILAALSICICVICTSCSDTMVELPVLYPKVIYSYDSDTTEPDFVLSIYSQVKSDAVRLSSMTVQHGESGLSWYIQPVSIMTDSKGVQYAGSSNLKMPEGQHFPEGLYTIIYKDYTGNTEVSTFTLENTVLEQMPESAGVHAKFIVYNNRQDVLYISSDTNDVSDTMENLSARFADADIIREYISDIRKKAVYILPAQTVRTTDE